MLPSELYDYPWFMTAKAGQKTLYAECDPSLHAAVAAWQESHDKAPMRQCILGGVKIFLALPDTAQGILMACRWNSSIIRQIGKLVADATITATLGDSRESDEVSAAHVLVEADEEAQGESSESPPVESSRSGTQRGRGHKTG